MSSVHHIGLGLQEALISGDEDTRIFARLTATPAGEAITDWFNAELARGTNRIMLFHALAKFGIQVHASIAAQEMKPGALPALIELYKDLIESEYPQVFGISQAFMRGKRK